MLKRMIAIALLSGATLGLAGCAGSGGHSVAWEVESCCNDLGAYGSFVLEMENLPGFLEPYFYTEVIPVMQARGMTFLYDDEANVRAPDLVIWLAFDQMELRMNEDAAPDSDETYGVSDPERLLMGGDATLDSEETFGISEPERFLARIRVEFIDAATGGTIASGVLARVHNALPGGYMHEERARSAIRYAFQGLVDEIAAGEIPGVPLAP